VNARAFDLYVRSLTAAALAIGVLVLAAFQVIHSGKVDTSVGAFVGLVLGFYFGAHVSQVSSSSSARRDQLIVAETNGLPRPPDDYDRTPKT
jgi:ribose/xylose/arabinose/galactoside ABC-type transport system permease subunit